MSILYENLWKNNNDFKVLPIHSFEIVNNDDPTLSTITLTIFVVGCVRRCIGCQNSKLQILDNNYTLLTIKEIKEIINEKLCLIKSVCFCGGDFLPNYQHQLKELIVFCKNENLKTILYTGELYENIDNYFHDNIDIIVDGPYDYSKKTNKFPASLNQRCWINGNLVNCDDLKINQ